MKMKKNLIYTLLAAIVLVVVYSFTVKSYHKKSIAKVATKQQFSCGTVIQSVTGVYNGPYSVTISWTYTGGAPDHFTYGGNYFCTSGNPHYGTSSTTSTSVTLSLVGQCAYTGLNGRIIPICADGTEGTAKVYSITP
jgi:hypothetical protein